jgi:SAM-dependent methyltransferase
LTIIRLRAWTADGKRLVQHRIGGAGQEAFDGRRTGLSINSFEEPRLFRSYRLRTGFEQRAPWITRFDIAGRSYGGSYHAELDHRLKMLIWRTPEDARVLELGCLEGGHSTILAQHCRELVAVDIQESNLSKARWVSQAAYKSKNIRWVNKDVEIHDFDDLGRFDIAMNMGVLYHLSEPWNLLRRLARVTRSMMWLWTHYAPEDASLIERGGYAGILYDEPPEDHPLRGMRPESFWPTLPELQRMLVDAGFDDIEVLNPDLGTRDGPAVLLAAHVGERTLVERVP